MMLINRLSLIIIFMLLVIALSETNFASDQIEGDYKTLCLGDNLDTVKTKIKSLEESEITDVRFNQDNQNNSEIIFFYADLLGKKNEIKLIFFENKLRNITINLDTSAGSQMGLKTPYLKKIIKLVSEKYGNPKTPDNVLNFFAWPRLPENKIFIYKLWELEDKNILITMINKESVHYSSDLCIADKKFMPQINSNELKEKAKEDL